MAGGGGGYDCESFTGEMDGGKDILCVSEDLKFCNSSHRSNGGFSHCGTHNVGGDSDTARCDAARSNVTCSIHFLIPHHLRVILSCLAERKLISVD